MKVRYPSGRTLKLKMPFVLIFDEEDLNQVRAGIEQLLLENKGVTDKKNFKDKLCFYDDTQTTQEEIKNLMN